MSVRSFPSMWEAATMIMLGKHKQGDAWLEGQGDVPCPEVCRNDKYRLILRLYMGNSLRLDSESLPNAFFHVGV